MRSDILQNIVTYIKTNGQRLITGQVLQDVLTDLVDNVGVLGEDAGLRDYNTGRDYTIGDTCVNAGIVFRANQATTGSFQANAWDIIGQMPVVADIAARDALTFRREGLLVYVLSDQTTYRLTGGMANTDWQELGGVELHTYSYALTADGEQNFTVPARQIVAFRINGVVYPADTYSLGNVSGNTQTLTWDAIDDFALGIGDVISVVYNGTEVTIKNSFKTKIKWVLRLNR